MNNNEQIKNVESHCNMCDEQEKSRIELNLPKLDQDKKYINVYSGPLVTYENLEVKQELAKLKNKIWRLMVGILVFFSLSTTAILIYFLMHWQELVK